MTEVEIECSQALNKAIDWFEQEPKLIPGMSFSDFVESVLETPICCELKQPLNKIYEFYAKNPEKCILYLTSLSRKSAENVLLIVLPLLLDIYASMKECGL